MAFDAAPIRFTPAAATSDCLLCPVRGCLGRVGAAASAGTAWSEMLAPRTAVMPGAKPLFSAGEPLQALYSVRGGCIKTYTVDADGNERIRGFYLPGDLVGLDALHDSHLRSTAAAVVPSQVCVAPIGGLRRLLAGHSEFGQQLMAQTSRELALALALSGNFTAEQRLAAFLLNMQERLVSHDGLVRLPMTQRDIGNYLRLATETVCRTLKGFEKQGWLACEDKGIRVLSTPALHRIAEPVGICQPLLPVAHAA